MSHGDPYKNNIVVGNPDRPVAVLERGRRVLTVVGEEAGSGALRAMDHDAGSGVLKLIPGVTLLLDVPDSMDSPWLRGDVFVSLRDAVWEQSSWLRVPTKLLGVLEAAMEGEHGEALQTKVSMTDKEGNRRLKPILVGLTDGGGEHRTTFATVHAGLAGLFRKGDFDYIVFIRTCPGQSYMNFVERVMAILNIGCSGVAIMRDELHGLAAKDGRRLEVVLKGCQSLKDVREKAKTYPELQAAVGTACARVKELLLARWDRMSLVDKPFRRGPVAGADEL